jgi:MFS family permease
MPGLRDAFAATPHVNTLVGLVITLPSLGIVLTAGFGGWLCDRFGRRRVMLTALVLYAIAGVSATFASSLTEILIGRLLLGIGIGGTMTSAMALVGDLYQGPARARFFSLQPAVMSGSSLLMLLGGGVLGEFGWRYPFLIYGIAAALVPLVFAFLPEPARAISGANAAMQKFNVRPILVVGVSALTSMILFYQLPIWLPFLLKDLGAGGSTAAALVIGAGNVTMVVSSLLYGRFGAGLNHMLVYVLIFTLTALGFGLIATAPSWPQVVIGSAVTGAGYGWLFPANNILLMERASEAERGRAAGFHTTAIFLGQFLAPLFSGPIVDRSGTATAFAVFAVVSAVLAIVFFTLSRRSR